MEKLEMLRNLFLFVPFLSCLMTYAQIEKLRAEKVMFSDLE